MPKRKLLLAFAATLALLAAAWELGRKLGRKPACEEVVLLVDPLAVVTVKTCR